MKSMPEQAAVVTLPTTTVPSYVQTIVGKCSPISDKIEEFRGIPYAHVPGRWEHSQLRHHLPRDIFDATENGPICPHQDSPNSRPFQSHLNFPDDRQDEFECLNLLVVRPSRKALSAQGIDSETAKLPVAVWIHGGAFSDGAATFPMWNPSRLVLRSLENQTPIIVVAINYRLNIFGFGASSDMIMAQQGSNNAPLRGLNFGLRDQKVALIWVKHNIEGFGGDNAKITIMGHSAGGISCHIHLLEAEFQEQKRRPPLFQKAVLQSGAWGGLNSRSLAKADERWADLCRVWSVDEAKSPVERLNLLKRIPTQDLFRSTAEELHWGLYMPVIDDLTIKESGLDISICLGDADLNNHEEEFKSHDENIQVMIGATDAEVSGFVRMASLNYTELHATFAAYYPSIAAAERVLQAYSIVPTSSKENLCAGLVQLFSDLTITHPVHCAGEYLKKYRMKHGKSRVGVHSYHVEVGNPFLGPDHGTAHHGVDLIYLFDAFHDALEIADSGVLTGFVDPREPAHSEPGSEVKASIIDTDRHGKSNAELSLDMQDMFIKFIVADVQECDRRSDIDEITTYGRDRIARTERWGDSEKWISRKKRYDVLEENLNCALAVMRKLVGKVLNQPLD